MKLWCTRSMFLM